MSTDYLLCINLVACTLLFLSLQVFDIGILHLTFHKFEYRIFRMILEIIMQAYYNNIDIDNQVLTLCQVMHIPCKLVNIAYILTSSAKMLNFFSSGLKVVRVDIISSRNTFSLSVYPPMLTCQNIFTGQCAFDSNKLGNVK